MRKAFTETDREYIVVTITFKAWFLELAIVEYMLQLHSVDLQYLLQVIHPFFAESEKELSLSVGEYVVVRKVLFFFSSLRQFRHT